MINDQWCLDRPKFVPIYVLYEADEQPEFKEYKYQVLWNCGCIILHQHRVSSFHIYPSKSYRILTYFNVIIEYKSFQIDFNLFS